MTEANQPGAKVFIIEVFLGVDEFISMLPIREYDLRFFRAEVAFSVYVY